MPLLSLDPVPLLETADSGLLLFRDNVQLNYNKIQDIVNKLDSVNIKDGTITAVDLVAALPRGSLGYAYSGADEDATNGATLSNLSVTATIGTTRLLMISANSQLQSSATSNWYIDLLEDGGAAGARLFIGDFPNAGSRISMAGFVIRVPSSGSHTYALQANRFGGSGTLKIEGSAGGKFLVVQDIGSG